MLIQDPIVRVLPLLRTLVAEIEEARTVLQDGPVYTEQERSFALSELESAKKELQRIAREVKNA